MKLSPSGVLNGGNLSNFIEKKAGVLGKKNFFNFFRNLMYTYSKICQSSEIPESEEGLGSANRIITINLKIGAERVFRIHHIQALTLHPIAGKGRKVQKRIPSQTGNFRLSQD